MSRLKVAFVTAVAALIVVAGFVYIKYSGLQTDYQNLKSRYTDLQSDYTNVSNEASSLSSSANNLQSEVDSLESSLQQAQSQINMVKARVYPTTAQMQSYVTPNDSAITSRVATLGGTVGQWDWNVAKKCLDWIVANIEYQYDPAVPNPWNYAATAENSWWKKPSETISDGNGDCEDQAALLCSMLRAIGGTGSYCLVVRSSVTGESGHVLVITRVDGQNAAIWDSCYKWTEWGIGYTTCPTCHGTGEDNCMFCNGTGQMTCFICGGDGEFMGATCNYCGGTGIVTCLYCKGTGKQTCFTCWGSGKILCPYATEKGYYKYGHYSDVWNEYKANWKQWVPLYVFRDGYSATFNSETEFLDWLRT